MKKSFIKRRKRVIPAPPDSQHQLRQPLPPSMAREEDHVMRNNQMHSSTDGPTLQQHLENIDPGLDRRLHISSFTNRSLHHDHSHDGVALANGIREKRFAPPPVDFTAWKSPVAGSTLPTSNYSPQEIHSATKNTLSRVPSPHEASSSKRKRSVTDAETVAQLNGQIIDSMAASSYGGTSLHVVTNTLPPVANTLLPEPAPGVVLPPISTLAPESDGKTAILNRVRELELELSKAYQELQDLGRRTTLRGRGREDDSVTRPHDRPEGVDENATDGDRAGSDNVAKVSDSRDR